MKVERLKLLQFRNIASCELELDPHLNFFCGANAQGKTSILEAIGVLSGLQSFRHAKLAQLISWKAPESHLAGQIRDGEWESRLEIGISEKGRKSLQVNGKKIRSATEYLALKFRQGALGFHAIIFHPADHQLVQGDPKLRRQYLNQVIAAESESYLLSLKKFQRVLEQRNALLKAMRDGAGAGSGIALEEFTRQLITHGALVLQERLKWISRLNEKCNNTLSKIALEQGCLEVRYESKIFKDHHELISLQGHDAPLELLEEQFEKTLRALAPAEQALGVTLAGPHRDDWTLTFSGEPLKGFGSQGEVRTALLALKLTEIELFRSKTGLRPLLLLDDFSSELDEKRRGFLLNFLCETDLQVFVTTTERVTANGKVFQVEAGTFAPSSESEMGLARNNGTGSGRQHQDPHRIHSG